MQLKQFFLFCAFSLLLGSCATSLRGTHTDIEICTRKKSSIIMGKDTFRTVSQKTVLFVERNEKPLEIESRSGKVKKVFFIPPRYSVGSGKYVYPKRIYIDTQNTSSDYFMFGFEKEAGEFWGGLWYDAYGITRLRSVEDRVVDFDGFFGLGVHLNYAYKRNRFIGIEQSFSIKAARHNPGVNQLVSTNVCLTNNYYKNGLSIGYGVSYQHDWLMRWSFLDGESEQREKRKKIGLAFVVKQQFFKRGYLRVGYVPTFYRFGSHNSFIVEHTLSLGVGLRFNSSRF